MSTELFVSHSLNFSSVCNLLKFWKFLITAIFGDLGDLQWFTVIYDNIDANYSKITLQARKV